MKVSVSLLVDSLWVSLQVSNASDCDEILVSRKEYSFFTWYYNTCLVQHMPSTNST